MLNQRHGVSARRSCDQHPRMRPELRAAVVYALAEAGDNERWAARWMRNGRAARTWSPRRSR